MVAGVLASEDGGRLAGARAGQHGVRPLPVVPGPGGGLKGDTEEVLSSIQRPAQDVLKLKQKAMATDERHIDPSCPCLQKLYTCILALSCHERSYGLSTTVISQFIVYDAGANEVKKAVKTFDVMERFKVEADQTVFYSLLRALCRSKNIEDAEELLLARRIFFPLTAEGFNIILDGWCNIFTDLAEVGNLFDTLRVYDEMKKSGWIPRIDVYNQLIYVLTRENCVKVYNECAAELRVGVEGEFHVGRESVDEYCGGACFVETEMALRCVKEVTHDSFTFSNGASLFDVKQALGSGCSYTPEIGTFDIRERRECRDEYGYGYDSTHEQLGYGEEGGDRQYEYPGGAFGNYCSGAIGGGPVRMLLLASFLASASASLLLAI
ncbi:hypothetical protein D1007_61656 [Hordeum vulgare]|nr:hypothetical protein D1007_61656 [Hordeum vulgare]